MAKENTTASIANVSVPPSDWNDLDLHVHQQAVQQQECNTMGFFDDGKHVHVAIFTSPFYLPSVHSSIFYAIHSPTYPIKIIIKICRNSAVRMLGFIRQ